MHYALFAPPPPPPHFKILDPSLHMAKVLEVNFLDESLFPRILLSKAPATTYKSWKIGYVFSVSSESGDCSSGVRDFSSGGGGFSSESVGSSSSSRESVEAGLLPPALGPRLQVAYSLGLAQRLGMMPMGHPSWEHARCSTEHHRQKTVHQRQGSCVMTWVPCKVGSRSRRQKHGEEIRKENMN